VNDRAGARAYANAEHQSYLGAHRDDCSRHEARHAAVLSDTLRYLGRAADRTQTHQATCSTHTHTVLPRAVDGGLAKDRARQ